MEEVSCKYSNDTSFHTVFYFVKAQTMYDRKNFALNKKVSSTL